MKESEITSKEGHRVARSGKMLVRASQPKWQEGLVPASKIRLPDAMRHRPFSARCHHLRGKNTVRDHYVPDGGHVRGRSWQSAPLGGSPPMGMTINFKRGADNQYNHG